MLSNPSMGNSGWSPPMFARRTRAVKAVSIRGLRGALLLYGAKLLGQLGVIRSETAFTALVRSQWPRLLSEVRLQFATFWESYVLFEWCSLPAVSRFDEPRQLPQPSLQCEYSRCHADLGHSQEVAWFVGWAFCRDDDWRRGRGS